MFSTWLSQLQAWRAIAVIRSRNKSLGLKMAKAAASGGMKILEITWNSEQPEPLIEKLRSDLPHCLVGAGTILDHHQLQQAIAAGAQFIFSPHVNPSLIQASIDAGIPINPGALSPTEIVTAWQSGASCVKVFPIQAVGGVDYLKSLQGPLGQIPVIPSGGVTLENASDLIAAGAIAVGLSNQLFPQSLIVSQNWDAITQRAKKLQHQVQSCPDIKSG